MSLKTWEQLHKGQDMKSVAILINIGWNDMPRLQLNEAYQAGAVVSLEEAVAARLIEEGLAKESAAPVTTHRAKHAKDAT